MKGSEWLFGVMVYQVGGGGVTEVCSGQSAHIMVINI